MLCRKIFQRVVVVVFIFTFIDHLRDITRSTVVFFTCFFLSAGNPCFSFAWGLWKLTEEPACIEWFYLKGILSLGSHPRHILDPDRLCVGVECHFSSSGQCYQCSSSSSEVGSLSYHNSSLLRPTTKKSLKLANEKKLQFDSNALRNASLFFLNEFHLSSIEGSFITE